MYLDTIREKLRCREVGGCGGGAGGGGEVTKILKMGGLLIYGGGGVVNKREGFDPSANYVIITFRDFWFENKFCFTVIQK